MKSSREILSVQKTEFKRVGLTGGIASGKSAVAEIFRGRGFPVIDADQLVKELSAPGGAAYSEILARFGTADRREIREIIYKAPEERKALEAILHPKVLELSRSRMLEFQKQGAKAVFYEAALLIEAGRQKDFDELIVVVAPEPERIQRLCTRDQISREQARAILNAQLSDSDRTRYATFVLRNDSDLPALENQVEQFLREKALI